MHTDLKVGKYWGQMGVDFWTRETWNNELKKYEVLSFHTYISFLQMWTRSYCLTVSLDYAILNVFIDKPN